MSVEQVYDSADDMQSHLSLEEISLTFKCKDVSTMVQREILPQRSHILGVGATMAAFGQEVAFLRSDVHWTNVASEYSDPEIIPLVGQEPSGNVEFLAWDISSLDDIYPDKTFDCIYAHGRDLEVLTAEQRVKMGNALLSLLNDGGTIAISAVDQNFIENASYNEADRLLTYSATKVTPRQPHLTTIPAALFEKDAHEAPLHLYVPQTSHSPSISTGEVLLALGATIVEAGWRGAGKLYSLYSNRSKRRGNQQAT